MAHDALLQHALELLSSVGRPRARRMFGGQGLYVDDVFIALIAHDRLYLKTDELTRARFEAAGAQAFSFHKGGEAVATHYLSAPEEAMDSAGAMAPWARLAMAAALRARQAKPPGKPVKARPAPAPRGATRAAGASQPPAGAKRAKPKH